MMNWAPVAVLLSANAPPESVTAIASSSGNEGGAVAPAISVPPMMTTAPETGLTPGAGEPFGSTDQPAPPPPLMFGSYDERS
jgi:hypothetical protein